MGHDSTEKRGGFHQLQAKNPLGLTRAAFVVLQTKQRMLAFMLCEKVAVIQYGARFSDGIIGEQFQTKEESHQPSTFTAPALNFSVCLWV